MFSEANINTLHIQQKKVKKYHYNREDTMSSIFATHIGNVNETFIGIFMGIPLGYIVYYHHGHD